MPTMKQRAALLGVLLAMLALVASRRFVGNDSSVPSSTATAAASAVSAEQVPVWLTSASCEVVRRAPPPEDTAGTLAPDEVCPVTDEVRRNFARTEEPDASALQLFRDAVEKAVTEHPVACARALSAELAKATRCGLVYDAVAIRVINGKGVPVGLAAAQLGQPAACRWKLLASLREATRAEPTIVASLLRRTAEPDTDIRNAAWMTLGTLEFIARGAGQGEVVECLESALSGELGRSNAELLPVLLGAAGNAGCVSCRPTFERLLSSEDARLRRTAVAAFRFLDTPADVETMCRIARSDRDDSVRGSATYALRHAKAGMPRRLECLYAIATEDAAERVALDAVGSLSELADASELVVGTLVEVARETPHPKVRNEAVAALRAHASDDAIKDALTAPRDE
jgi:hypothetical protein